jgi:hypothetical protein
MFYLYFLCGVYDLQEVMTLNNNINLSIYKKCKEKYLLTPSFIHSCIRNSFYPPVLATPAPSRSSSSVLPRSLPSCPLSFTAIMISTAFLILCWCFGRIDCPCSVEVGCCCLAMYALTPCSFAAAAI